MLYAQAGTADINQWASFTKRRYNALQVAVNRPFKAGLLLKGAYTLSKAMDETDDDGWTGLDWNQPSQLSRNYALAGYDRTHNFQMGFLYDLPFGKGSSNPVAMVVRDWQLNGVYSFYSGTPFTIGGDNTRSTSVAARRPSISSRHSSASEIQGRTPSTTTPRRSPSRATSGATRDGTSSVGRACGTSTWVCSVASRWDAIAWSSVRRPATC